MEKKMELDPSKLLGFKLLAKTQSNPAAAVGAKVGKQPAVGAKIGKGFTIGAKIGKVSNQFNALMGAKIGKALG